MQNLAILGSTGSIGQSTLDVVARHPDKYNVIALTANKRLDTLVEQAAVCLPKYIVCCDENDVSTLKELVSARGIPVEVLGGKSALIDVSCSSEVDTVMAAIVGAAGLQPTYAAVCSGKKVLLANKESLVMSGQLFMDAVKKHDAQLLPVDSEHNAIFQCLPIDAKNPKQGVSKILLTGSGGPFLNRDLATFDDITPAQACKHPNWSMGQKISVDSATMMNKGLEFVEAKWLFQSVADIEILIHPQSIIHSMVQYNDGSVLAQMGRPDMRTPIAHTLAYPERIASGVAALDFSEIAQLTFCPPDFERFPCLKLAIEASGSGQAATTAMNAANEVAVEAFLQSDIRFTQISDFVRETTEQFAHSEVLNIEDVVELDLVARTFTQEKMRSRAC